VLSEPHLLGQTVDVRRGKQANQGCAARPGERVASRLALTVDVERDWGIAGTEAVHEVLPRLLDLLDRHHAFATLFVVADLLDENRDVLSRAAGRHEIGSHGLTHRRLDRLTRGEVLWELTQSRECLSSGLGCEVVGFRAPFLRVVPRWFELLAQAGYRYDSSVGRVYPSPRNVPPGRWRPVTQGSVVELAPTTLRTGLVPLSMTYLRLTAPVGERLVPRGGGVFYLHAHELARPSLARRLRLPVRWVLPRGAGEPAWRILERLLERWSGRVVSCRMLLQSSGLL